MNKSPMLRVLGLLGFLLSASGSNLDAASPPGAYRITGIVVDSVTGQPLEGAEVTIISVTNSDEQQAFVTSIDGRFAFANLPRDKYRLMASRRGYANQGFHQHEGFMTAIAVGPGLDSEHIRFPLVPSSVITGVVTDEWGDPVREAKVLLFQQNMFDGSCALRNVNQTVTDDQGRYRFAHLLSGTYAVAIYARPWYAQSQTQVRAVSGDTAETFTIDGPVSSSGADPLFDVVYPTTFFANATSLADAARLALIPGAAETADFQLRAVPSVHLRVRVPVPPPTTVTITSKTGNDGDAQEGSGATSEMDLSAVDVGVSLKIGDSYTDQLEPDRKEIAPGLIELSGIPPGEINLAAASIQTSALNPDGFSFESRGKTLNVSGDTEVDLSALGDNANVSGVVLSSQFSPAPAATEQPAANQATPDQAALVRAVQQAFSNVTLTLHSTKTGETYDANVSTEGKFSFPAATLPAGSYEVEFPQEAGLRVSSLDATGTGVSGRTVELTAGRPVNLVVHAAEAKCSLSGFALKNGKPVAGAMVLIVPQDPGHDMSLYHRDQSDSDGSFAMSPLFPGRYTLLAIENGWDLEWANPAVLFRYLPSGQLIEFKPGDSLTLNAKVQ